LTVTAVIHAQPGIKGHDDRIVTASKQANKNEVPTGVSAFYTETSTP